MSIITLLDNENIATVEPDPNEPKLLPPSISSVPSDWPQASSWHFEGFALETTKCTCKNCNLSVTSSKLYRMFVRHFPAATDRRFVPAKEFVAEFPVVRLNRPDETTEICVECVTKVEGNKQFRICDEAEFKAAAAKAREEVKTKSRSSTNIHKFETKAQVVDRLKSLL